MYLFMITIIFFALLYDTFSLNKVCYQAMTAMTGKTPKNVSQPNPCPDLMTNLVKFCCRLDFRFRRKDVWGNKRRCQMQQIISDNNQDNNAVESPFPRCGDCRRCKGTRGGSR